MFKHLSLSCLLLAMVVPSCVFAAPKGEKVGSIRGVTDPAYKSSGSCADDAKWSDAKLGSFRQLDCFKTGDGGSVNLELKENNSTFSIAENSLVSIDSLVEKDEDGAFRIKLNIQKGYMGFKAAKNKGNVVDFTTGTAAASIRGTEGFIGGSSKVFFSGLKNGRLVIIPVNGDSLSIGEGQTVVGRDKFVVLQLKSSGDLSFAKILNELLADTTKTIDDLVFSIVAEDEKFQANLAAKSEPAATADSSADETNGPKSDKNVVPKIKYSSYDSLRCVANVSVSDIQKGADARLFTIMDGSPISEVVVKRNMLKRISLRRGVHEYEFVVKNDKGENSVKKTLGCYQMKSFSVKVFGSRHVRLQIPPPPPGHGIEDVIMQTLQFQIRLPENDPSFLNTVTVRQNGKVLLQERLSQIQNLDYQIPVKLKRGYKNRFSIEVIHKSGYIVKATKVYEVGK